MSERSHRWLWSGILLSAIALVLVVTAFSRELSLGKKSPSNRPIMAAEGTYITSNACRACHPGNYGSWHTSFHRTMTQVATAETLIPKAPSTELEFAGRQYRLERTANKVFVSSRSLGEKDYGPAREVVLLTGSHNLQILWTETAQGRTLEQFPFAYIIAEKMWSPVSQTFLMPPGTKEVYQLVPGMAPAWIVMSPRDSRNLSKAIAGIPAWPSLASPVKPVTGRGGAYRGQSQPAAPLAASPNEESRSDNRERFPDERAGVGPGLRAMS